MKTDLSYLKITNCRNVYYNLPVSELIQHAIKRNEGVLCENGALVVNTGKYTGRSPKDRFIVNQDSIRDKINWGNTNLAVNEKVFVNLYHKVVKYLENKDVFVFDGFVGAMKQYSLSIRVVCECASQAMFSNQLFRVFNEKEKNNFVPEFTVISAPGFKAAGAEDGINSEAFVIINFERKIILIGGTQYSGEIKKAVFSVMNFLLPLKGVLPMHCSANKGKNGDTAVFFGLSGTGKTTLSADPERILIGDDEHGWCDDGIFNFEGGCYAKTINLSREREREIFDAIKFGTVLENVVLDDNKKPIYDEIGNTENTRAAYPIDYIENADLSGLGAVPNTVIFLTADAFGVMPPICRLSKEAAMYYFMSGYTSKVAGTERGIVEPQATFSTCFGEPFMLMNPMVYAELLGEKIEKYDTEVYMINTGWISGGYGRGERIKLSYTRNMVKAVLDGKFNNIKFIKNDMFNVMIPEECPGVPSRLLNPKNTWSDKDGYDEAAEALAKRFQKNFKRFRDVSHAIENSGPCVRAMASTLAW